MADYLATGRTNYFGVKDDAAFRAWAKRMDLAVYLKDGKFALTTEMTDHGTWPDWDLDKDEEMDVIGEIAEHLADGEVCILMEAGAEKHCYVSGYAWAFDNTGRTIEVRLGQIYELAEAEWGRRIPAAEY